MGLRRAIVGTVLIACLAVLSVSWARAQTPSWRAQLTLPSGDIQAATFASPDVVWATGSGGIFRSADAGRSWSIAYNAPQPLDAISAAPDGMHGWAVGALGLIAATNDGGATWHEQASGTQVNLWAVAALGDRKAIAAGVGSGFSDVIAEPQPYVILRTDDGGASWSELRIAGDYRTRAINFLSDGKHGWMAAERCVPPGPGEGFGCDPGSGRALLRTGDGGRTWAPVSYDLSLYQMQFVDTSTGWGIGCDTVNCTPKLLRTTDGGATWQNVRETQPAALYAFDARHAIIAEYDCTAACVTRLATSHDGGATWSDLGEPVPGTAGVLRFAGGGDGVLLGMNRKPRWTATAGVDWHEARFPVVVGSGAVDFVDASRGWLAASELLRTDDGGATWSSVSDNAFSDLAFVSAAEGWATRSACSGVCETAVLHTTDGGATWAQQFTMRDPNIPRLVFTAASDGWLLFESDGRELHTRDGGATWYEQQLPTKPPTFGNSGRAVFVDGSVGWAATVDCDPGWSNCRDHAFRTLDGGDTWSPVSDFAVGDCYVFDVASIDVQHAWIVGADCLGDVSTMYRTDDGGNTWSAAPLAHRLSGVSFFDAMTGRAIAEACDQQTCASRIARTADGGATWAEDTTTATANPFTSRVEFASPEHAWLVMDRGGGMTSTFSQAVFAYAGTEPALRPIVAPTTGTGAAARSDADWPYAALIAAVGAALLALARRLRGVSR